MEGPRISQSRSRDPITNPFDLIFAFSLSCQRVTCLISAVCAIEAQAYSGKMPDVRMAYAYVKLNGVAVWRASLDGEYPRNHGANVMIVNPSSCTMQEWHNFDTYDGTADALWLRAYLQGLRNGTVLVGVSCDSADLTFAFATLRALGADISDVGFFGAWVFVAVKGDPSKTVFDKIRAEEAQANSRQPRVNVNFGKCNLSCKLVHCARSLLPAMQLRGLCIGLHIG